MHQLAGAALLRSEDILAEGGGDTALGRSAKSRESVSLSALTEGVQPGRPYLPSTS
jgi:hypothetical protein